MQQWLQNVKANAGKEEALRASEDRTLWRKMYDAGCSQHTVEDGYSKV